MKGHLSFTSTCDVGLEVYMCFWFQNIQHTPTVWSLVNVVQKLGLTSVNCCNISEIRHTLSVWSFD